MHTLILFKCCSPSDWTYVESELKRRLGRNFLIYGMLANLFMQLCCVCY